MAEASNSAFARQLDRLERLLDRQVNVESLQDQSHTLRTEVHARLAILERDRSATGLRLAKISQEHGASHGCSCDQECRDGHLNNDAMQAMLQVIALFFTKDSWMPEEQIRPSQRQWDMAVSRIAALEAEVSELCRRGTLDAQRTSAPRVPTFKMDNRGVETQSIVSSPVMSNAMNSVREAGIEEEYESFGMGASPADEKFERERSARLRFEQDANMRIRRLESLLQSTPRRVEPRPRAPDFPLPKRAQLLRANNGQSLLGDDTQFWTLRPAGKDKYNLHSNAGYLATGGHFELEPSPASEWTVLPGDGVLHLALGGERLEVLVVPKESTSLLRIHSEVQQGDPQDQVHDGLHVRRSVYDSINTPAARAERRSRGSGSAVFEPGDVD